MEVLSSQGTIERYKLSVDVGGRSGAKRVLAAYRLESTDCPLDGMVGGGVLVIPPPSMHMTCGCGL